MQEYGAWTDLSSHTHTGVQADGNGLANALAAFNGGNPAGITGQLVLSSDGSMVGWHDNTGYSDWHSNTGVAGVGAFWGILADHGMPGVSFIG